MNDARNEQPSLLLVDDDATFCAVLSRALEKRGFAVTVAHSVEEATPLAQDSPPEFAVVDLKMDGASGLVLIRILHELDPATRIVVLTGYSSIATAVSAIKQGAFDFLTKPFKEGELLQKVKGAIALCREQQQALHDIQEISQRADSCTPREQDVMLLLAQGLPNKGIAEALSISPRTVEIHRAHVMEKMEADSLPALVRMLTLIGKL